MTEFDAMADFLEEQGRPEWAAMVRQVPAWQQMAMALYAAEPIRQGQMIILDSGGTVRPMNSEDQRGSALWPALNDTPAGSAVVVVIGMACQGPRD